jgi:hypothetical protein
MFCPECLTNTKHSYPEAGNKNLVRCLRCGDEHEPARDRFEAKKPDCKMAAAGDIK